MPSNQDAIIEITSEFSSENSNEEQDPAVIEYLKAKEHTKKMQLEYEEKKKITDAERIERIKRRSKAKRREEAPESIVVRCAHGTQKCISITLITMIVLLWLIIRSRRSMNPGGQDQDEDSGPGIIGIILLIIILPIVIFCAWINIWFYYFSDNKVIAKKDDTILTNNEAV